MPKRSFEDSVIDVLRLSEEQWGHFRGVAGHWLGGEPFHVDIPKKPPVKLLRSSLKQIRAVPDKNTLAALMHVEDYAHHNSEFHKGGGLSETANSIMNTLYNLVGFGPEFDRFFENMGWKKPKAHEKPIDRYYARIVQESYMGIDKRDGSIGGGTNQWVRLPRFDTEKISAWLDRGAKKVHVALKGTSSAADIVSDLKILASNRSGHEKEIRDNLRDIVIKYGNNYTYDVSAHSLGATEIMNVFQEDDYLLNKYDLVNLFNPGVTPTHNLDAAKMAAADDRFKIFLNSGDILSNAFVSLVKEDSNVAWADASHSPSHNHGISQWVGEVV